MTPKTFMLAQIALFIAPLASAQDWPPPSLLICNSGSPYYEHSVDFQIYLTNGEKSRTVVKSSSISRTEKCDILTQLAKEVGLTVDRLNDDKILVHGKIGNVVHDGENYIGPRECLKPVDVGLDTATEFANETLAKLILRTGWMKRENSVPLTYRRLRVENNVIAFALYKNCIVDFGTMTVENFAAGALNLGK